MFAKMKEQESLISYLKVLADNTYQDYPNLAPVSLAQAILESGLQDGIPSQLAQAPNYNLFGIKAVDSDENVVSMPTWEVKRGKKIKVNAWFKKFSGYEESFEWHRRLMLKPRYKRVLTSQSPSEAFNMLYKSGYATDPKYPSKLQAVFDKYLDKWY